LAIVGLVGVVGEHLRARATLLAGSEEHWRRRSMVVGEAVAGDELALGPEVHGASSSGVLRGEGKVGVSFPIADDDGVVVKGGDGESRAEKSVFIRQPPREEEGRCLPRTNSAIGDGRVAAACVARGAEAVSWSAAPARGDDSGH
jgi:hypothetical protein